MWPCRRERKLAQEDRLRPPVESIAKFGIIEKDSASSFFIMEYMTVSKCTDLIRNVVTSCSRLSVVKQWFNHQSFMGFSYASSSGTEVSSSLAEFNISLSMHLVKAQKFVVLLLSLIFHFLCVLASSKSF